MLYATTPTTTPGTAVMHFKNAGEKPEFPSVPILSFAMRDKSTVFFGDAEGWVKAVDIETEAGKPKTEAESNQIFALSVIALIDKLHFADFSEFLR